MISAFLSHLAQRALRPQPELQPRLASRFEPAASPTRPLVALDPTVGDEPGGEPARADARAADLDPTATANHRPSRATPSTGDGAPPGRQETFEHGQVRPREMTEPNAAPPSGARTMSPLLRGDSPTRDEPAASPPSREVRHTHATTSSPDLRIREASAPADRRPTARPEATHPSERDDSSRFTGVSVVPVVRAAPARINTWTAEPQVEVPRGHARHAQATPGLSHPARDAGAGGPVTNSVSRATTSQVVQPIIAEPRVAVPRIARDARGTAAEPPAIHVTIGRVEVRATTAPPAARAVAPNKPALSLAEYLRQRGGAAR